MFPISPTVAFGSDDDAVLRLARVCGRLASELTLVPLGEVPALLRDVAPLIPPRATPLGGVVIHHLVQQLILQVRAMTPHWDVQWDSQLVGWFSASGNTSGRRLLWHTIFLLAAAHPEQRSHEHPKPTERRVAAALEAVCAHYHDAAFGLKSAASYVQLSPWYLDRLLARHTGYSFVHHLRKTRLDAAQHFLGLTLFSIKEVAAKVGYNSVTHLERDFRAHVGCSPSEWRRQNDQSTRSQEKLIDHNIC
jgi:AraC-like DNA-binding protein